MYTVRCAEKLRAQNSSAMLAHIFVSTNPFRKDLKQYTNYRTINFPVPTNDTSEMLSYILKTFNDDRKASEGGKYMIPTKGTVEYAKVRALVEEKINAKEIKPEESIAGKKD